MFPFLSKSMNRDEAVENKIISIVANLLPKIPDPSSFIELVNIELNITSCICSHSFTSLQRIIIFNISLYDFIIFEDNINFLIIISYDY